MRTHADDKVMSIECLSHDGILLTHPCCQYRYTSAYNVLLHHMECTVGGERQQEIVVRLLGNCSILLCVGQEIGVSSGTRLSIVLFSLIHIPAGDFGERPGIYWPFKLNFHDNLQRIFKTLLFWTLDI